MNETVLVILMLGLMTHVGDEKIGGPDPKNAVAIIADRNNTHHVPVLYAFTDFSTPPFTYHFLPHDRVTFVKGVSAGAARTTCDFRDYTPSILEPLTNSLVDEPVTRAERHKSVAAWIDYPEGELGRVGYQPDEANFFRGSDLVRTQCVPAATYFFAKTETNDDILMQIEHDDGEKVEVPLTRNAFIFVVNQPTLPLPPTDPIASAHFANYGSVLKRRYGVVPRRIASVAAGDPCTLPGTLPRNTTLGDLALQFVTTRLLVTDAIRALQMQNQLAAATPEVFKIRVSEHPACTNTDWP